jgi:LPS export ABC transporter protein LptC
MPCGIQRQPVRPQAVAALVAAIALSLGAGAAFAQQASPLEVSGMTFVGTRIDGSELVVRAVHATFAPREHLALLREVDASARDAKRDRAFEIQCEKAELNLETNDFRAEGAVRGRTQAGESYSAPWVQYDRKRDLLFTDAKVKMENEAGRFSGDGFRYHVKERRFELRGNVQVEQAP